MKYAEVILPLPLEGTFTYAIPIGLLDVITIGSRVVVMFGKKKIYTGIVLTVHEDIPEYLPKEILDVLDNAAIINQRQLTFFQWMARYYMCALGEVINAALPAALKLSSESFVGLNPEIDPDRVDVADREWELLRTLKTNDLSIKEVGEFLSLKQPQRVLKNLSEKGYIDLFEKVKDKYQPKTVKKIRIKPAYLRGRGA